MYEEWMIQMICAWLRKHMSQSDRIMKIRKPLEDLYQLLGAVLNEDPATS